MRPSARLLIPSVFALFAGLGSALAQSSPETILGKSGPDVCPVVPPMAGWGPHCIPGYDTWEFLFRAKQDTVARTGATGVATTSGTLGAGNCVSIDTHGNLVDAGVTCTTNGATVVGTGAATPISLANRVTDFGVTFKPQDFGAACDGVTDDTAALTAWLAKAASNVHLVAPAGTCAFATPLAATANNFTITGAGTAATVLKYTGASTSSALIALTGSGVLASDFQVKPAATTAGRYLTINGIAFTPPSPANIRVVNVLDFGADPTGSADSTAAFNAAFANGTDAHNPSTLSPIPKACVYAPKGNYLITNALTPQFTGSCLFGDGRTLTTLMVYSTTFNLSAQGVVVLPPNGGGNGNEVHDIGFAFTQPDQTTRAALAGMPPAIYAQDAGRTTLRRIRVQGAAETCIDARGATGGDFIQDIECSSVKGGLLLGGPNSAATTVGAQDSVHLSGWHQWNFGVSSSNYPGIHNLQTDGTNVCIQVNFIEDQHLRNGTIVPIFRHFRHYIVQQNGLFLDS